jgi:gamma-glutamylputrescine oxidase
MTGVRPIITHMPVAAPGVPPWGCAMPLPAGEPPKTCDVLIVGAGITGLTAAMSIAQGGRDVTVIDRAFGSGATSRSGGIVLGDTLVGPVQGFGDCHEALRSWVDESGADCDLVWGGCFELARDASLPSRPIDWQAEGTVRLAGRISGGVLHPMKFQHALLDTTRLAGVALVNHVTVVGMVLRGSRPAVLTEHGQITAQQVVMAVDATARADGFDPWSERVITVALQTAPLSEAVLAAVGLTAHQAFYTRDLPLLWGRVMADRSLLIGRETLAFPGSDTKMLPDDFASASARLTARVHRLHPALMHVEVCRTWGGPIARSPGGVPAIVVDPNHPRVLWVGGYGGHGMAQAFKLGRLAADRLS